MIINTWQDTRGLWYAREHRPFGAAAARRVGPYGTEAQAKTRARKLAGAFS